MKSKVWMVGVVGAAILAGAALQGWSGSACCGAPKKVDCKADKSACGTNACPAGMSWEECKAKGLCPHADKGQGTNGPACSSKDKAAPSGM